MFFRHSVLFIWYHLVPQRRNLVFFARLHTPKEILMARVTGIGGVFLKARDPKALAGWYAKHLGIQLAEYGGATLLWSDEIPAGTGQTTWMLFPDTTKHFGAATQRAMINYRVDDLEGLLTQLRAANVTIDTQRESAPYGHFAWITDPEGNRVELWQPLVDTP
jgi:predicted enzyme related to lactoylglutathione lyase